jgi:hypothetical protein
MPRTTQALALAAVALFAATGCQSYNFNPVGHCVLQPGSKSVTLSNLSTADVLFVVDESGSMSEEQQALADNFQVFINNLDTENADRASRGLQPIDFHIAVTTTSVFENSPTTATCSSTCGSASGQLVCCSGGTPALQARACTSDAECFAGTTCGINCTGLLGEKYCCNQSTGAFPAGSQNALKPCALDGEVCGVLKRHYTSAGALIPNGWPYPHGDFVSAGGATPNPRVLHFDKALYPRGPAAKNKQGFTADQLIQMFKDNIKVGTVGSGQEQGLQGGRLALTKAFGGQQGDTFAAAPDGAGMPVRTWDNTTRTPLSKATWPNPGSKLVVVFVGDEDDCSSPEDPSGGVVLEDAQRTCEEDPAQTAKQFPVSEFVDYFTSLGHPVAAGFIFPANQTQCTLDGSGGLPACTASGPAGSECGTAYSRGPRFLAAAQALAARGVDVVAGSICDPSFNTLLDEIAEIVKPPSGLTLPTVPAADDVTLLRIADGDGQTRRFCGRPAPAAMTASQAAAAGFEWWFTATGSSTVGIDPVAVSRFVHINPSGACIANPGETYSADYLGQVPAGGCQTDAQCASALGGDAGSWTCYAGVNAAGVCSAPTVAAPGTCICGARSKNCPNG